MRAMHRWLAVALAGALAGAGCGDEEEPPPVKQGGRAAAGAAPGRGGPALPTVKLLLLRRIEDRAADKKERDTIRHTFRDNDFAFDPTGTMNRDPFRSYVISQPGVSSAEGGLALEPTEVCPARNQIATGVPARELKLIGIVSRGTTRWALLEEAGQKGHIVHLNDCVGKEKSRVTKMGATFVDSEIAAEVSATGQPLRPAEKITWQLHPKQLPVLDELEEREESSRSNGRGRGVTPGVAPPPRGATEL
jgi:Tfp pilus assembly protein PilP